MHRATFRSNRSASTLLAGAGRAYDSRVEVVDTNALIRTVVADLVGAGLSQAELARHMKLEPTWLSRWLNQKAPHVLPVSAVDGLLLFLHRQRNLVNASIITIEQAHTQAGKELQSAEDAVTTDSTGT